MSTRLRVTVAVSALVLAAGCSEGSPTPESDRSASASATSPSGPKTPTPSLARPTFAADLKESEVLEPGRGLRILRTLPTQSGEAALLDVLSDGRLLVRRGSSLRLEGPTGREVMHIQVPSEDAARGVFAVNDDGRHVVWVTTNTRDYFHFPWRMFAADLRTGVAWEVARHHNVGVDPVPVVPNGTSPRLLGGRVYYAAVKEVTGHHRVVPAIYSVPVDGSEPPRIEVEDAYDAFTLGDRLVYTTSAFGFVDWQIHTRLPGRPGTDEVIASGPGKGQRLSGITSDGRTLMWQASNRHDDCSLHFVSIDGHQPADLGPDWCEPVWSAYHHIGGEWAAFSTGSSPYQTYVYRFSDSTLYRLTDGPTYGFTYGSGDIITWRPDRGPDRGKTIVARMALD